MAHGAPDWWGSEPTDTVHMVQDAGELAARLGSPVTYDRRGNVIWIDSFEGGLGGWIPAFSGTGGDVVISSTAQRTGSYSAKFITGKAVGGNASLSKYHPRPKLCSVGLEVAFAPTSDQVTVRLQLYHYDGANYHLFSIRYDYPNQRLQYLDNTATWQTMATGVAFYPNYTSWNVLKLVVDVEDNKYYRVLLNDTGYSLAGVDALTVASVTAPYLGMVIFADGNSATNYVVYIDDVILTQNEP